MNLIDAYRYLAALEQHRHFGRAAAACHITQPALSNALRALEAHFELGIVRRGRQYEGLTPEGQRVLATAHRVLHEQEALQQELASPVPSGRLVIGAVPTALPIAARFAARLVERHPALRPQLRSLSSQDIEHGLEALALDLGLGYTERAGTPQSWPQYVERYYLVARHPSAAQLQFGPPVTWHDAAQRRLALLSPEMHNRAIIEGVFSQQGLSVTPAIETNSVMALVGTVLGSDIAAVLPGALVGVLAGHGALRAQPLIEPAVLTAIGFMSTAAARPSRALAAALALAADPQWLTHAQAHSGALHSPGE
jgi:DNA-binding transcriptional LysR family regulator